MRELLGSLQRAEGGGPAGAAGQPAAGQPAAGPGADPGGAVSEATRLSSEPSLSAEPSSAGPRADGAEAARSALAELQEVLVASGVSEAAPAEGGAEPSGAAALRALSRMKKSELVEECLSRGLLREGESPGTVAELRATLRVERKRDALIGELVERGFAASQARSALQATGWSLDAALAKLLK